MGEKTSAKVKSHEHYPYQCNRRAVQRTYLALSEYRETGVRMPNPVVQGLQLHPVPAAHRLPVGRVANGARPDRRDKKEISWQAVYYHFRKWRTDGSLEKVWQASVQTIQGDLDLSPLNLDGSHAIAQKGGESVAYQGRKRAKTSNILSITDVHGYMVASTGIIAGNHNDAFNLKAHLQAGFKSMKRLGLPITGAFFNADRAFATRAARKVCFNHGVIPNIAKNQRNRKTPKRGRKRLFNADVYKRRFPNEHSFAWVDKFRALLIRFDRMDAHFLGAHHIAVAMINLRHVFATKV
jgi:transposase